MKLKFIELLNMGECFKALRGKPMNALYAFNVVNIGTKIAAALDEARASARATREKLIEEGCPEAEVEEEMKQVLQAELEVNADKLKLSWFKDVDLEPLVLSGLMPILEDDLAGEG